MGIKGYDRPSTHFSITLLKLYLRLAFIFHYYVSYTLPTFLFVGFIQSSVLLVSNSREWMRNCSIVTENKIFNISAFRAEVSFCSQTFVFTIVMFGEVDFLTYVVIPLPLETTYA